MAGLKVILKHAVLRPVLETAWRLGLIDLTGHRRLAGRVAVLMYHRLVPDQGPAADDPDRFNPMTDTLTISRFSAQMRWLARRATVIGLEDLAEIMLNGRTPPRNAVLITFDDGWQDTFLRAAPIINDLGLRAAVFVSVDAVEERRPLLVDELTWILQHHHLILDRGDTPEEIRRLGQG
ncbi:MAG: polysaccharide deacetylase family protein, partial [Proteobacteria bacterium]|nr:polysaccharide deacetylase family protein [Pseudomonadota bacterium]